mgnify:CR=1 FL=1
MLAAKRLELLHMLAPDAATIAVLVDPTNGAATDIQMADLQEAARRPPAAAHAPERQQRTRDRCGLHERSLQRRAGALLLTDNPLLQQPPRTTGRRWRAFIAILTMYTLVSSPSSGGLISYASSITDATRRAGVYVARILKGEKPGDLPIQLPTKFELVINLKTAKALGLDVPPSLLARRRRSDRIRTTVRVCCICSRPLYGTTET